MLRPRDDEVDAWLPCDVWETPREEKPLDRAAVIAAAREQRSQQPGLAVDDDTLERVADCVLDPNYWLPGLYYTPEEAADGVPQETRDRGVEHLAGRPGLSGGTRMGWRDGRRVMVVRVVEDLEEHRMALAELCGDQVVVEAAAHSEQELEALHDRVWADDAALRALVIDLALGGPSPNSGTVEVEIVAADAEQAARTLLERYGPLLQVTACSASWSVETPRPFGSWSTENRRLAVFYALDRNGEEPARCDVVEREDSVVCTITILDPAAGIGTLIAGFQRMTAEVDLRAPVGHRTVIDGSGGEPRPSLAQLRAGRVRVTQRRS